MTDSLALYLIVFHTRMFPSLYCIYYIYYEDRTRSTHKEGKKLTST